MIKLIGLVIFCCMLMAKNEMQKMKWLKMSNLNGGDSRYEMSCIFEIF